MTFATIRLRSSVLALSGLVWLGLSADSHGGLIPGAPSPTITVSVEGVQGQWRYEPMRNQFDESTDPDGGLELVAPKPDLDILSGAAHVEVLELEYDPDPFVLNNILITNNTAAVQSHSVVVALPTSFGAPNIVSGNILTGVIDGGGAPGATLSSVGALPIYHAQIDGVPILGGDLQPAPFTLTAPAGSNAAAAASFGPFVNAVPVGANISILLRFNLSPGDTASILSRFDVVAVPEPTCVGLVGAALAMAAVVRRRG